jgi:hypothetical protein
VADTASPHGVEPNGGDTLQTHYQRVLDYRQRYGVD